MAGAEPTKLEASLVVEEMPADNDGRERGRNLDSSNIVGALKCAKSSRSFCCAEKNVENAIAKGDEDH